MGAKNGTAFKKVGQKRSKIDRGVKFENFEKTKKVPLENVTRVPCVKYLSPRMNRKKMADNYTQQQQTTDTQTEATTILEMQNLHFK